MGDGSPPDGRHRRHRSRSRSPRERRRHHSRSRSHERRRRSSRSRSRSREKRRRTSRSRERAHAPAVPPAPAPPPPPPPPLPLVGSIHRARVERCRPFGVFVSLPGVTRHGLVPANAVSEDMRFGRDDSDDAKVQALEWACPLNRDVWVKLIAVGEDEQRGGLKLTCAMAVVDQATGSDLDPGNTRLDRPRGGPPASEEPPPVGSVHRAVVQDLKPYGVFVSLPGFRRSGLVHSSQVSEHLRFTKEDSDEEKVASLAGVVAVGDSVWVKVVEVEGGDGGRVKVGCSMRYVNQGTGLDLDPNNTHYRPRGAPRDGGGDEFGEPGRETAVVRAGVVQWGHHLGAVKSLDGRTYELLKEEEQPEPPSRIETKEAMLLSAGGGGARAGADFLAEPAPAAAVPEVHIGSVEEAQAILARYQRKAARREAKRQRKERKTDRKKGKKEKHKRRSRSKDSSSTSS